MYWGLIGMRFPKRMNLGRRMWSKFGLYGLVVNKNSAWLLLWIVDVVATGAIVVATREEEATEEETEKRGVVAASGAVKKMILTLI
jgi:hypothetical protein